VYWRNIKVDCVCESILDKKYRGFPVSSMKIGCLVWVHAVAFAFKTVAVTDAWRLTHMVEMLDTYVVVILLKLLLTVVMRLSLYTTTLCMLKESSCRRVSEIVCMSPPTDTQNTDVLEKTNPRQHVPARDSVAPIRIWDVFICTENSDSWTHAVLSVPESTIRAA
jgi:hypothetical protein